MTLLLSYLAMRKLFIILAMVMGISIVGAAQESPAKVEKRGNTYVVVSESHTHDSITGKFYQIDGVDYPMYIGTRGGVYYFDKNNKKQYVDVETRDDVRNAVGWKPKAKKGGTK